MCLFLEMQETNLLFIDKHHGMNYHSKVGYAYHSMYYNELWFLLAPFEPCLWCVIWNRYSFHPLRNLPLLQCILALFKLIFHVNVYKIHNMFSLYRKEFKKMILSSVNPMTFLFNWLISIKFFSLYLNLISL